MTPAPSAAHTAHHIAEMGMISEGNVSNGYVIKIPASAFPVQPSRLLCQQTVLRGKSPMPSPIHHTENKEQSMSCLEI